jgi:hypothetical protein
MYFEWGNLMGGMTPSGAPVIPAAAPYGPPEEFSGTLGAGVTTITFTQRTKRVTIRNTHDTQILNYSLDGGATWFVSGPYQVVQEWVNITNLQLRPAVAGETPTYEITAVLVA